MSDSTYATDLILGQIKTEREKQVRLGFNADHDAGVGLQEWQDTQAIIRGKGTAAYHDNRIELHRRRLIQEAALLVAQIETLDREGGYSK